MEYITFESDPIGAELTIEDDPCGAMPVDIELFDELTEFRRDCIREGVVFCNWPTLQNNLVRGLLKNTWWDLTDGERYSITDTAVREWTRELTYPQIKWWRSGAKYCEGGIGAWSLAQCIPNAIIRYSQFGKQCESASACYYRESDMAEEEYCYCESIYHLPTYIVNCITPIEANPGFGHTMAAIQIKQPIDELSSYYIFQYNDYNIQPGGFNMPTESYDELYLKMVTPITINCTGFTSITQATWRFIDGELA